jgi:hypothetical protein
VGAAHQVMELPAAAVRRRSADDIAAAMREEYTVDKKGRRVRRLHPAPLLMTGTKEMIWDDIKTAVLEDGPISADES